MSEKLSPIYQEPTAVGDAYRQAYADGIARFIAQRNAACKELRRAQFSPAEVVQNAEEYRTRLKKMLGMELFANTKYSVTKEYVGKDALASIWRLTVTVMDCIPFYALLMIPHERRASTPLVIAQHGGGGTPELCSDFYGKNNYNGMVRRALSRGCAVLAPQLLLWAQAESETQRAHAIPYSRRDIDRDLKRFGASVTALEISCIQRILDYLLEEEGFDESRVGMMGISYGGYFTLHTMAVDTRIRSGYCAAVFNDRDRFCFSDWSYTGSANAFQDAEVAALCAPRHLFVQVGKTDSVFDYQSAVEEARRVPDYFEALGASDRFRFSVWDGGHTISDDDTGLDFFLSPLFD